MRRTCRTELYFLTYQFCVHTFSRNFALFENLLLDSFARPLPVSTSWFFGNQDEDWGSETREQWFNFTFHLTQKYYIIDKLTNWVALAVGGAARRLMLVGLRWNLFWLFSSECSSYRQTYKQLGWTAVTRTWSVKKMNKQEMMKNHSLVKN